jgi:hypothetical protein
LRSLGRYEAYRDEVCDGYNEPPIEALPFLKVPAYTAIVFLSLSVVAVVFAILTLMAAILFVWHSIKGKGRKLPSHSDDGNNTTTSDPEPFIIPSAPELPNLDEPKIVKVKSFMAKRPSNLKLIIPPPPTPTFISIPDQPEEVPLEPIAPAVGGRGGDIPPGPGRDAGNELGRGNPDNGPPGGEIPFNKGFH